MRLIDLVARWLNSRGALITPTEAGVRVELAPSELLVASLGDTFTLMEIAADAPVPPGVEPVYPGSRITDLCAGDLEGVRGLAVVARSPRVEMTEPLFVFSFLAVVLTNHRSERLIRFALASDGQEAPLPPDDEAPLGASGGSERWRGLVERLMPTACQVARERALEEAAPIEHEAQRQLYVAARRLAHFYGQHRQQSEDGEAITAEYQRRLREEVDRHRVRLALTLIGVTVVEP